MKETAMYKLIAYILLVRVYTSNIISLAGYRAQKLLNYQCYFYVQIIKLNDLIGKRFHYKIAFQKTNYSMHDRVLFLLFHGAKLG